MGDLKQAGKDRQKGRIGSDATGRWNDKDDKYIGWKGRTANDKIILTRSRQGTGRRTLTHRRLDRSGRGKDNCTRLERASRGRTLSMLDTVDRLG
jgi:hypothetical protein